LELEPLTFAATDIISEAHKLTNSHGLSLHLHAWHGTARPDKIMVVVHGMGGHGGYYANSVAPYIAPARVALYAPDLRGHGLSEGRRGDIENFNLFQDDVATVVRWVRQRHPGLPLFLLGESMGTPIAITYAATAPADARPDFLALIACVVAPTVKPHLDEIFRTLYYLVRDRRRCCIPITGREEEGIRDLDFIKVLKADVLFNRKVSVRFLSNMTLHMQRASRLYLRLTLPIFMAQGGRDFTVRHRQTRAFFARIASTDKELHYYPEAYHALLNDPEAPLVRRNLLEWLKTKTQQYNRSRPTLQ
jgi:alpha-beta hydrolase superfamily lysophospholipase